MSHRHRGGQRSSILHPRQTVCFFMQRHTIHASLVGLIIALELLPIAQEYLEEFLRQARQAELVHRFGF